LGREKTRKKAEKKSCFKAKAYFADKGQQYIQASNSFPRTDTLMAEIESIQELEIVHTTSHGFPFIVPPSMSLVHGSGISGAIRKDPSVIASENRSFRGILESKAGIGFLDKAETFFKSKGLWLDKDSFEKNLNEQIIKWRDYRWDIRRSIRTFKNRSRIEVLRNWKNTFDSIFVKTCTETYLDKSRLELSKWINDVQKGRALFVDCPMGVGKTYSIAKVLAERTNLSAVIFMPTLKLCRKLIDEIKGNIVSNNPSVINDYPGDEFEFPICDSEGEYITDEFDFPIMTFMPDFLENEVFLADGINKHECIHFDKIIKRYSLNWIQKGDICRYCAKNNECRFLEHDKKSLKARIVITTHRQYDHFINSKTLKLWATDGDPDNGVPRDLFVVDEDIVISKCYQPYSLSTKDLDNFIRLITGFITDFEFDDDINVKLNLLLGQVFNCKKSSFVKPIDPEFSFSEDIRETWKEEYPHIHRIFPEDDSEPIFVGNHLDVIENGIKFGFVVQKHGKVHKIHFNNSTSYDLSNLPPHVFFDGTMLAPEFLEHKLKGVEFKKTTIEVKSLWNFRVKQNINTDITKTAVLSDQPLVEELITDLLTELGPKNKYLFLSNKTVKSVYLEKFLEKTFPGYFCPMGYFFNLRGINDAQDCNVGIMLGSALPSDAIEVAMAIELIQDKLPDRSKTELENNFWVWEGSKGHRSYKDKYKIIELLAKAYRLSEQRQAMARSRYLFHDVDFYVLSKDRVAEYEPYAEVIDEHFGENLFKPRRKPPNKYPDFVKYVYDWFESHKTMQLTDIYKNQKYDISKGPARIHAKRMLKEGLLAIAPNRKKIYVLANPNDPKNGHPIL
jgi:hypothetical protein